MTTAEILRAARAKIDAPERWTKGTVARDAEGRPASPVYGVAWCAVGAIESLYLSWGRSGAARRALGAALPMGLRHRVGEQKILRGDLGRVSTFNDAATTTHEMILALYDRAIADAERAQ